MWRQWRGYGALTASVIVMVLSGAINQVIFVDEDYPKPLLVTLFCNALFSFGLLSTERGKRKEDEEGGKQGEEEEKEKRGWLWNKDIKMALPFAFLFFISNYFFNISLEYTTVSSTTAIGTTTAVWCLVFANFYGLEPLTPPKLIGLALCLLGTILISFEDLQALTYSPSRLPLLGDLLSFISAILYALYTVHLSFLPKEVKMFRFFGYMGIASFYFLFPMLFIAHITGFETIGLPSFAVFVSLLLNGLVGTLFTQYLYSLAVLWTSPLIAGVGTTLTIPVAEIFDLAFRGAMIDKGHAAAMGLMIAGFAVVTWEKSRGKREKKIENE